jgi:hypothetical protein
MRLDLRYTMYDIRVRDGIEVPGMWRIEGAVLRRGDLAGEDSNSRVPIQRTAGRAIPEIA